MEGRPANRKARAVTIAAGSTPTKLLIEEGDNARDRVLMFRFQADSATVRVTVEQGVENGARLTALDFAPNGEGRIRVSGALQVSAVVTGTGSGILTWTVMDDTAAVEPVPPMDEETSLPAAAEDAMGAWFYVGTLDGHCAPERYTFTTYTDGAVRFRLTDEAGNHKATWSVNGVDGPRVHPPRYRLSAQNPGGTGATRIAVVVWR